MKRTTRWTRWTLGVGLVLVAVLLWQVRASSTAKPTAPAQARGAGSGVTAQATAGKPRRDPRSLTRGTITGTVTIDGTNTPLAGAQVCARGESHDLDEVLLEAPTCAITDAAGHYQLAQLLPAQYRVGASARTYRPALHHPGGDRHQVTLVLAAGETKANVDIALRGGGVEVTGSVSDVTGGPIVRARVGSYEAPGMVAETDDQGAFRLWVAPGYVSVEARADGYAATSESVRAPGKVALFLTPASSLAGTVVDAASGQPVEGARVQIEARDSTGGLFSDADGAFRVTGLGPGRHVVIAHTERGYGRTEGSTLVGLGEQVDGVVVKLFPSARVEARVQIAATRQPCVEAEATLRDAANNRWLPMKRDPDGQLWLDGVLPGTYTPEITCRGFVARETYPTVAITNAPVTGVVWEVDAGATIRGRVLTKAGTPVEDALVRARTIGGAARSKGDASADLTAREGAYELTGLRPGTYKINVSSQLYVAPTDGSQVEVAAGAIVEKDLVLEDSGLLDGTVVDADGKPVGDVDVVARLVSGGGRASGNGKTDETGRFHLTGLRAGDYRVTAARGWSEPLRKPGTTDDARQGEKVSVRANQTATVRLVIETVTGSITGSVVDALGAPVSDAFVSAARESDAAGGKPSSVQDTRWSWSDRPVVSGLDGTFTLTRLAPGTYTIRAFRKGGGEAVTEHVAIGAVAKLQIKPTGSIAGTARRTGGPITELQITLHDDRTGFWRRETFYMTSGQFVIRDLPAGSFQLTATSAGAQQQQVVELAEGQARTGVEIEIEALVTLRGRVIDQQSGKPVAGIRMSASRVTGGGGFRGGAEDNTHITDDSGAFTIEHAPHGRVLVEGRPRDGRDSDYAMLQLVRTPAPAGELGDLPILRKRVKSGDAVGELGLNFAAQPDTLAFDQREYKVSWIDPAGPAVKSGIEVGDIVTTIDGIDITGTNSGNAYAQLRAAPGTRLVLGLERGVSVTITLAAP